MEPLRIPGQGAQTLLALVSGQDDEARVLCFAPVRNIFDAVRRESSA